MTRQLDLKEEQRETARRIELIKALEYGIVGALAFQHMELAGLAIRYDDIECTLTIKAVVEGRWMVAFVSSDTMMGCLLRVAKLAKNNRLRWLPDKYHQDQD